MNHHNGPGPKFKGLGYHVFAFRTDTQRAFGTWTIFIKCTKYGSTKLVPGTKYGALPVNKSFINEKQV